jgi:hypothetical protein
MRRRLALLATVLGLVVSIAGCADLSSGNSYWYCWDDGHGGAHHLGYPVSGDHLCSDAELKAAGK